MRMLMTGADPKYVALQYGQCVAQLAPRETGAEVVDGNGDGISGLWERDVCFEQALRDGLVGGVGKAGLDIIDGNGDGVAYFGGWDWTARVGEVDR